MTIEKSKNPPIIKIEKGWVKGKINENVLGGEYYSFQGMRYAKPPLGELRFKAPREEEPWEGVYDATEEGQPSLHPQRGTNEIIGSEDCLFINVFVNELPNENTKPKAVMFWIHGGGWNRGSSTQELFGPDYLLKGDVVFVTFNYRLGLLGLASFKDPEIDAPGNAILKDMIQALKWVNRNIAYFNGDPNNITIFGESSGGIAIHMLAGSIMAKGFFHKGILMSSTNFCDGSDEVQERTPKLFAKELGFESDDEREIYEFLLDQPGEKLVEAGESLLKKYNNNFSKVYPAIMETAAKSEELCYYEKQDKYLKERHINAVPVLIGSVEFDGIIFATEMCADKVLPPNFTDTRDLIPPYFSIPKESEKAQIIGDRIKNFYYGLETPSYRCLEKYIKLQTDLKYRLTAKRVIKSFTKYTSDLPMYYYRFSFDSPYNLYKKMYGFGDVKGAGHGDELTYLFHTKFTPPFPKGSVEEKTLTRMVTFWTNFAKYGDPNPTEPVPYIKPKWLPVEHNKFNHMDIGRILKYSDKQPDHNRMEFWDKLHEELGIDII